MYNNINWFSEFAPNFENNPPGSSQLHLDPGSSPKLRCKADGNPRPEIEWTKNGRILRESGTTENFSLKLNNIQEDDAGLYMCRVFNNLGSINFTYNITITGWFYSSFQGFYGVQNTIIILSLTQALHHLHSPVTVRHYFDKFGQKVENNDTECQMSHW